ncbi:MAG: M23 family metallopeptidase [Spirochaetaceae bacterium]|nr:M23 family metallopeptidase [Spirochaetaceae bacterium]
MKNIFLICFFLNSVLLFSLQWPVENPVVKANFGEKAGSYYNTGIDILSEKPDVFAVDKGEIVYYQEENNHFSALPSGLGNFIVIEHDRLLRTTYGHLDDNSIAKEKIKVAAGEVIGKIGDSGSSNGRYLHFELVDREFSELINPLILLPAIADKNKPIIKEVFIKNSGATQYKTLQNNEEIKAGKYDLSAVIYDFGEKINYFYQIAPYSIKVYINGEEFLSILYNSIKKSGNHLVLSSNNRNVKDYYIDNENWQIYLGQIDFKPGLTRIEISVSDFKGNEFIKEFKIISLR